MTLKDHTYYMTQILHMDQSALPEHERETLNDLASLSSTNPGTPIVEALDLSMVTLLPSGDLLIFVTENNPPRFEKLGELFDEARGQRCTYLMLTSD